MVLNKIDRVASDEREMLALELPDAIQMCAKAPDDVAALRERVVEHFLGEPEEAELFVPWALHGKLQHQLREHCRIVSEQHDEAGARVTVRAPGTVLERLRAQLPRE